MISTGSIVFDPREENPAYRHLTPNSASKWSYPQPQPKYCEKCGRELEVIDNRVEKFDRFTGESYKRGIVMLRCPKYKIRTVSGGQDYEEGHDNLPYDPTPSQTIVTWSDPMGPHYRNGNLTGER